MIAIQRCKCWIRDVDEYYSILDMGMPSMRSLVNFVGWGASGVFPVECKHKWKINTRWMSWKGVTNLQVQRHSIAKGNARSHLKCFAQIFLVVSTRHCGGIILIPFLFSHLTGLSNIFNPTFMTLWISISSALSPFTNIYLIISSQGHCSCPLNHLSAFSLDHLGSILLWCCQSDHSILKYISCVFSSVQ